MSAALIANLGLGQVRIPDAEDRNGLPLDGESPAAGFLPLRQLIAERHGRTAAEVALTTGASLGLVAALADLERPGSVLLPRPFYPAYPRVAASLGFAAGHYQLRPELGWLPDPADIARALGPATRALVWNFPHNPTGALPDAALLAAVGRLLERSGVRLISDEVYADLVLGGPPFEPGPALDGCDLVRLRSFSKGFGLTGERMGYALAAPERIRALVESHWVLAMSPPALAQSLVLDRLRADPEARRGRLCGVLRQRRDEALTIVGRCGRLRCSVPPAGIFLWLEVTGSPLTSRALAAACAAEAGVVVQPGSTFGIEEPVYLRASFALAREEMVRGFEALTGFLAKLLT